MSTSISKSGMTRGPARGRCNPTIRVHVSMLHTHTHTAVVVESRFLWIPAVCWSAVRVCDVLVSFCAPMTRLWNL